ncbi:unnamed protein product [Tenebrio molitor]|nr:unnamed protein product [Tenebrio molitor]
MRTNFKPFYTLILIAQSLYYRISAPFQCFLQVFHVLNISYSSTNNFI